MTSYPWAISSVTSFSISAPSVAWRIPTRGTNCLSDGGVKMGLLERTSMAVRNGVVAHGWLLANPDIYWVAWGRGLPRDFVAYSPPEHQEAQRAGERPAQRLDIASPSPSR